MILSLILTREEYTDFQENTDDDKIISNKFSVTEISTSSQTNLILYKWNMSQVLTLLCGGNGTHAYMYTYMDNPVLKAHTLQILRKINKLIENIKISKKT